MSLDYPNRADWLAIRRQYKPQHHRFNLIVSVIDGRAFTYNAGRNAEKRSAAFQSYPARTNLLADRRLRQRQQA